MYYSLYCAFCILCSGVMCYFLQRFDISEDSKLYKYRPKPNNILLKLKIFKNNKRFNYFLLIPYLLSWFVFISVFFLYCLYWLGVPYIQEILSSVILNLVLCIFLISIMLYIGIIQIIIERFESVAGCTDKESQKIAQEEIRRALKKSKTKKQRETKSGKKTHEQS